MSHLRAPAARADRRESGRHGRPVARTVPSLPETQIRPQLLRLAILPPIAVALSACAAVLFTVRSTGARPTLTLWAVLAGALGVTVVGIVVAAVAADRAAGSVAERLDALRRACARGEDELRALVEALRRGEGPPARKPHGKPATDADDFELLAAELARAHEGAVTAVVQAAQLSSHAGSEQKLEVFVNLARRLQSLVHREISILDELENEIEDPDLLKGLFHVDHLATRIRRHAENLAVLGGAVSRRQWSNPVSMTEVLRSAIAEVEQYSRVKLVPPIDGTLRGHAVADVIHLLAELVENATVFSAPHTQVLLRAGLVTSGLAVEVEDRGLGMPPAEQNKMNALLADPDQVNVASLLADGRIGLFVVSQLARRHGIHVRLQTNIYGGVQAVLVVPQGLLGPAPGTPGTMTPAVPRGSAGGVGSFGSSALTGSLGSAGGAGSFGSPAVTGMPGSAGSMGSLGSSAVAGVSGSAGSIESFGSSAVTGSLWSAGGAGSFGSPAVTGMPGSAGSMGSLGSPAVTGVPGTAVGGAHDQARPSQGARPVHPSSSGAEHSDPMSSGAWQPQHDRIPAAPARSPLPVRDTDSRRPNPAEALPGIRPVDRPTAEENANRPPAPLNGAVRGTMAKPQLPRRRAQEHIAPQLRGGPTPSVRQDPDQHIGHDPGLMAAFQRGISLAESAQRPEPAHTEADTHTAPATAPHTDVPLDVLHLDTGLSGDLPAPSLDVPRKGLARTAEAPAPHAPDYDLTARHDGSAPAG
ncbi:ATP-binding protein [Streptomyces yaanensis]|uniref:histidine kinase n=1 Tax=Streptomyces yaanensis TaxID=1142239 RepID=A0ABV7SDR5_9ACTN|nr:ATP-binding protein [Streptomyces sp. CGMCC 4.7035]WNB99271.1 ATP-binding protein [Streptomyces sp. CGMCC 4.7035]